MKGKRVTKDHHSSFILRTILFLIIIDEFWTNLENLFDTFHSSFVVPGFLSRWYFVQIDKANVPEKKKNALKCHNKTLNSFFVATHIEARFTMHIKHATWWRFENQNTEKQREKQKTQDTN